MADSTVVTMDTRLRGWAMGVDDYFVLAARAFRFVVSRPFYWRDTLQQMDRIGVGSLPIVTLTGTFTGMVLALQGAQELQQFGASSFLGSVVSLSMIRELGPVLAALGVAGRSGSAIAAELGSMRISEQVDALQTFGTDPIRKLVTPRLVATVLMLPVISIFLDVLAILGGMLVAQGAGVPADQYLRGMWQSIALDGEVFRYFPKDFVYGTVKPVVFGAVIALTGSYYGLKASGGSQSIGTATTSSVVTSSVLIFALDYFLTQTLLVVLGV